MPNDRRPDPLDDSPSEVWIEIVRDPDARPLGERLAQYPRRVGILALLVSALMAAYVFGPSNTRAPRAAPVPHRARGPGVAGVAAAYGHPLRCLTITIAKDPTYARADFNRASACGRYGWSAAAILHRNDGTWLPVLNATTYTCPVAALPRVVQRELSVCT